MTPRHWNLLKVACITFFIAGTYFGFIFLFNYYYKHYYLSNYKDIQGGETCIKNKDLEDGKCKINRYNRLSSNNNDIIKIENNIYPKIGTNIQFLLQSVVKELVDMDSGTIDVSTTNNINDNKQKVIYVTLATTSTKKFLKNWLCNIFGLENGSANATIFRKVLLISLDSDLCQEVIKEYKLSCLFIPAGNQSNDEIKTNDMLRKWNIFVVDVLRTIIDQGIDVFYFDTKTIWLKDPKMLLRNTTLIEDADIVLPIKDAVDQPFSFSSTPLLIHSTDASKGFLSKINYYLKTLQNDVISSNVFMELVNELCQIMYYGTVCREFGKDDVCDMKNCNNSNLHNQKLNQTIIFNEFEISINNTQVYTNMKRKKMWFINSYNSNKDNAKCLISRVKAVIR